MFKKFIVFLLILCSLLTFAACGGSDSSVESDDTEKITLDYSDVDVNAFVKSAVYEGLTVTLADKDASKEAALWDIIIASAQTEAVPEDKAMYYFNQTKEYYMYFAGDIDKDYEYVLKHFSTDEEKMMEEARVLVKKDLLYRYIVAAEGISITDDEKNKLFDKYVDKYVNDFGYRREYVLANMTEMIYDSMLYDKTMEHLIANNTFVINGTT